MEYKATAYNALCSLREFIVNGINADESDFVDKYDHDLDIAEDYDCGNMQADVIPPTDVVLEKYNITVNEYYIIANDISKKLSFGCCGWCI